MPKVTFNSNTPGHSRHLTKADLKKLGVEDGTALKVEAGTVVEVDQATADALVNTGDFTLVREDEQTTDDQDGDATEKVPHQRASRTR